MNNDAAAEFQRLVQEYGQVEGISRFANTNNNYTHIGGGNTRAVFEHPTTAYDHTVVVKMAWDRHTAYANTYEYQTSQNAPSTLEPYLAPVYDAADDGSWLVQRRVTDSAPADWKEVERAFEAVGVDTIDIDKDNIGVLKGDPVAYDYPFRLS